MQSTCIMYSPRRDSKFAQPDEIGLSRLCYHTINTPTMLVKHNVTRHITQCCTPPLLPYTHHVPVTSWSATITIHGLEQALELLLSAGDASDTEDKGVIDWFHDPELFDVEDPPSNFCQEIVAHATADNYLTGLTRSKHDTKRELKWQVEESQENFTRAFAAIVHWGGFIQVPKEDFRGMSLPQYHTYAPALSRYYNPQSTHPHHYTQTLTPHTASYGSQHNHKKPLNCTTPHSQYPTLSPYTHATHPTAVLYPHHRLPPQQDTPTRTQLK